MRRSALDEVHLLGQTRLLIDVHLVLIPCLLAIAAFFAASEAALFSLSPVQLEELRAFRSPVFRRIRSLVQKPDVLLSTLIIGNECLNITLGTVVTSLLESEYSGTPSAIPALVSVAVTSLLLLTFSEVLPKIVAFRMPALVATLVVFPMTWFHHLMTPVRYLFLTLSGSVLKFLKLENKPSAVSEKDFLTMVEVGAESGSLEREEKEMIFNVFHFSDLTVASMMTPWSRVFHLRDNLSTAEVLSSVRKHRFSRIPVLSATDDRLIGVLHTKELLKLLLSPSHEPPVEPNPLLRSLQPPYIVSTHKKIAKLFHELKVKKVHLAFVVDEYGKYLGIITLEDILNALFQTRKEIRSP